MGALDRAECERIIVPGDLIRCPMRRALWPTLTDCRRGNDQCTDQHALSTWQPALVISVIHRPRANVSYAWLLAPRKAGWVWFMHAYEPGTQYRYTIINERNAP